jgi:hypothetical protein
MGKFGLRACTLGALVTLAACGGADSATQAATNDGTAGTPAAAAVSGSQPDPSPPVDRSNQVAVRAAVQAIYGPYLMSAEQMAYSDLGSPMDRPIYSAALTQIIAAWRAANAGPEPTEFTNADWICNCQDWEPGQTSLSIASVTARANGGYQVTARFNPGFEVPITSTDFFMVQENGRWLVDDARFPDTGPSLRDSLIEETRNPG